MLSGWIEGFCAGFGGRMRSRIQQRSVPFVLGLLVAFVFFIVRSFARSPLYFLGFSRLFIGRQVRSGLQACVGPSLEAIALAFARANARFIRAIIFLFGLRRAN
jgi:hypothetical protein